MNNLDTLLTELEQARKNATEGEWNKHVHRLTEDTRSLAIKQHHYGICCFVNDYPEEQDDKNFEFIALSANNILKLIEACRVMKEALFQAKLDYETNGETMSANITAREALTRVDEICAQQIKGGG